MLKTKGDAKPVTLKEALREFSFWRNSRKKNGRIPSHLWDLAVRSCRTHSVNVVSRTLHIKHTELKKRVEAQKTGPSLTQKSRSEFIELPLASLQLSQGCVIEMEKPCALKMRIAVQGEAIPFALQMGQSFIGGNG